MNVKVAEIGNEIIGITQEDENFNRVALERLGYLSKEARFRG